MQDIDQLIHGFRRFHQNYFEQEQELFDQLKQGQHPKTLFIACSDSRVDPAILTDSRPGDLFVIRNVANLVPPYSPSLQHHGVSAALEYAVRHLRVDHVVVLGHSNCGGIQALMETPDDGEIGDFIGKWVNIARSAKEAVLQDLPDKEPALQRRACEQAAILLSLENLLSYPWVKEAVDAETLDLHGWYFDIQAGELLSYQPEEKRFAPLSWNR